MPTTHEDYWTGRVTYLGTGIADLDAAKKYLRDKFWQDPLEPVRQRPGARFYVSVKRGMQTVLLLGPYVSHMTALSKTPEARRLLNEEFPGMAFLSLGTCSVLHTYPTRYGR